LLSGTRVGGRESVLKEAGTVVGLASWTGCSLMA